MIQLEHVGKTYRSLIGRPVRAVDDVSLRIDAGEVVGIAGPNGAGKSTLIAMLMGFTAPTEGAVRIDGVEPRAFVEREGIAYVSELIAVPPGWRVTQALARWAMLAGVPDAEIPARVDEVIERLGIGEHRAKKFSALSKGNQQRLAIAQALLTGRRVVIFDEPTHGLDPVWTQRFRDLVASLRASDRAILIASHNLDELERVCDRVAIIDHGVVRRVVRVRASATATDGAVAAEVSYVLVLAGGDEHVAACFPGARSDGAGGWLVSAPDLAALNASLAALLARGALVASLAPTHTALEAAFRDAVAAS